MIYWKESVNEKGKVVYVENVSLNYDALLEDQPQEDGRHVLVLRSIWLPWPRLSGVWKFENQEWTRIMSMAEIGKIEDLGPEENADQN